MKCLPFQSNTHRGPVWAYTLKIGTIERHLDIFRWDDRLMAHEKASGMWWCTLDARGKSDVREFWDECVRNERVGRLYSLDSAFSRTTAQGAHLYAGPHSLYLVVASDNSGLVRVKSKTTWRPFPAPEGELKGIRRPLATRPTIWSGSFLSKFARQSLGAMYEREAWETMPEPIRDLWVQGTESRSIRLLVAVLALGWADWLSGSVTALQLWKEVLSRRPLFANGWSASRSLPDKLLRSPEVALPGTLSVVRPNHYQANRTGYFLWYNEKAKVGLQFYCGDKSAHEQMEHRLELRDWLAQFFSQEELEALLSS